jgi:chromosome segregation protein
VYLKRLELYGFKTFADRTDLEFGPGITAIVGPNGSGKSNLADAIVWCLGEQSLKSLRSGTSQDIIFVGSQDRRRSGVGEVSVTLDNSDGALPLDFSEITITRRVFRGGEGEYFINRVPCRLRDIHELLLDTGIGKNAYSVISQTEVDRLLSVRSEDRREIFEQAAGIQRYRQRKEETRRKLDRTCANLIRVNDIIHELEVQIAPLSQQCEAAREYRRLSKELYDLKLSLLVSDHRALTESLAKARERERELEQELESARTRLHQLAAQEAELRAQLQTAEERLEETRGLVARLSSEADRAEGRLNLTTQRIEDLQQQAAQAAQELAQLEQQKAAAEAELEAAAQERPALEIRKRELEGEIAALEEQLREESGALRSAGESAEEQRAEHLDSLREVADARNRLVQCESMLQAAQARVSRIAEQQAALDARRQEAEQRAAEAARAAERLRARRAELEAEVYSLRSEEEAARGAAQACEKQELALRERLSEVRARHQALQELEHSREDLRAGVRAVLAAVEGGRLPARYHVFADLIRVPGELEAAIESALGPAAGDLVVGTPEDAAGAIAFLKEAKAGRATFLPKSSIRPAARPEALRELAQRPASLGVAADLVSCEPGIEPICEHLLGRVLIAQDMEAAVSLSRDAHGWRAIVTRDGDLLRPWGAVTGGSPVGSSHLLGRAREIEGLQAEQASLTGALQRLAADLQEARQRAETVATAAEARRAEAEALFTSLSEAERTAEVLAESARGERARWEALAAERSALEGEIAQTEEERAIASARVQELAEKQEAVHSAVEGLQEALRSGQETREKLSAAASERRVALTAAEGDLRALEARAQAAQQTIAVLSTGIADKQALTARLTDSQQQALTAQEQLRDECERMREQHGRARQEEARIRDQRQAALNQLAANRESDAQTREEIESLQARLHRSQLRTTQLDSEIGFAERSLLEEYRISLEQAEQMAAPIEGRTAAQAKVKELQVHLEALGEVNLGAIEECERVRQRLESFTTQRADLEAARADLEQVMIEADREATSRFLTAFELLRNDFRELFTRLFEGGEADLILTDPEQVLECGVDVSVTIPGKKTRDLLQLSGGERALTAVALLFSLLKVKPPPFVILDEVDAPLDDSNLGRYCDVLRDFAQRSQFLVITHNKGTMECADTLYGVTMEEAGVSRLIGVRLREPDQAASPQPAEHPPAEAPAPEESRIAREAA